MLRQEAVGEGVQILSRRSEVNEITSWYML